jgi:hypothetical protein
MKISTDIDIDFYDRTDALSELEHIDASMAKNNSFVRHNSGVYFQNIPVNPFTGLASITYQEAEELGYVKVDFLNNSVYEGVKSEEHLTTLMNQEPVWELLEDPDFVDLLAHVHGHFDVVEMIKPKSISDLAICLALIRPGKRHLLNKNRTAIESDIWNPPSDGTYYFKKSHAFAFATSIVVQMNLLLEKSLEDGSSVGSEF